MIVWLIRALLLVALLSAIHVLLGHYLRWDRTKRLEAEFDSGVTNTLSRSEYVARGLRAFDHSLGKRLLWFVWLLPLGIIAALLFIAWHM